MRKEAGFEIADYIVTYYQADPSLRKAVESQSAYIKQETLSRELLAQPPAEGAFSQKVRIEGLDLTLGVKKLDAGYARRLDYLADLHLRGDVSVVGRVRGEIGGMGEEPRLEVLH